MPAWQGERLDLDWGLSVLWRPRGERPEGRAAPFRRTALDATGVRVTAVLAELERRRRFSTTTCRSRDFRGPQWPAWLTTADTAIRA